MREAVFAPDDKAALQNTALAAATLGLSAIATGLSASDEFTADEGDLMIFELNAIQIEAWVWRSEFADGDEVEVVGEQVQEKWIGFAVRRMSDGLLAVHPHCERGSGAFYLYAFKFVGAIYGVAYLALALFGAALTIFHHDYKWSAWVFLLCWMMPITAAMALFITWRVTARFIKVRKLADQIFAAYGWKQPKYINLLKDSKRGIRADDSYFMGITIFRYTPK